MVERARWFVTDPGTGKVVVAQWPNLPLAIYLAATGARVVAHPQGTARTVLAVAAGAAILVWSGLEIVDGDSPFRRVLGAVVFGATVVGIFNR